jgi:hypothetical protein
MPEYSGYISVNPVDWGKVAKDAGQEVIDVLKNRRDERIRLDDLNNNLQAEIANYEATKSPEANEFIMAGSQTARSYIQNQNDLLKAGQITPEQYKRNIQNTQVGFKGFKVVMDTFATNIEEARKLVESGVTGKQAEWVNDVNGKMLTLKDKLMTVGTNGNLYIKDVASDDLYDVQSLTNQQNRVVKKVQLVPEVDSAVKGLGVGAKYDAEDLANSILSSDSRVASVLADNLEGYNFTDKKERKENEILMERDANRVWSPKLTDAQRKKARQIVMDQIEARVSYKEKDVSMTDYQKAMVEESKKKRELSRKALGLKRKELQRQYGKELLPLAERAETVRSLKRNGDKSDYAGMVIGRSLPFMQGYGQKFKDDDKEEIAQAYEGYVVTNISPAKNGIIEVKVKRKGADGKIDFDTIKYTESDFESDVNTLLNKTENTKVRTAQLVNFAFRDENKQPSATQTKAAGDSIFK